MTCEERLGKLVYFQRSLEKGDLPETYMFLKWMDKVNAKRMFLQMVVPGSREWFIVGC